MNTINVANFTVETVAKMRALLRGVERPQDLTYEVAPAFTPGARAYNLGYHARCPAFGSAATTFADTADQALAGARAAVSYHCAARLCAILDALAAGNSIAAFDAPEFKQGVYR